MAWYADWEARRDAMVAGGLPVTIIGVELLPPWRGSRLLAVAVDIDERFLPRSHAARGFDLHLSLAFEEELTPELLHAAARLHTRWAGRPALLRVAWLGGGGAAMLAGDDPLASDPDVRLLHGAGSYAGRDIHVSL